jgi:4-aminobutyrate aminotransferase/(S)-3-amino-2-methylpropionate transaminase
MIALEFVEPGTRTPAPRAAKEIAALCHRAGVLTLTCGTFGNVIRLLPPLVISDDLLDDGLGVLEESIREFARTEQR